MEGSLTHGNVCQNVDVLEVIVVLEYIVVVDGKDTLIALYCWAKYDCANFLNDATLRQNFGENVVVDVLSCV